MRYPNEYPEIALTVFADNHYGGYVGRFHNLPRWLYHDLKYLNVRGRTTSEVIVKMGELLDNEGE